MMNPIVKQIWLDDLRNAGAKQGRGYLRTGNDEYCCFGRLCEVAINNGFEQMNWELFGPVPADYDEYVDGRPSVYEIDCEDAYPPEAVEQWAEINHGGYFSFTGIDGTDYHYFLTELNDYGFTFSQIADVVERFF